MSQTTMSAQASEERFPSLDSLRVAHSTLLKNYREQTNNPQLISEIETFILKGQATGVVLDNDEDRWSAQSILDYWVSILYRNGHETPDATLMEFDVALAPDLDNTLCPYLGLEAFGEKSQHLFFGRQALINRLIDKLRESQLLFVIGSSGSGKSSAVLGGLIPKLKFGALPGSDHWHYFPSIVPGSHPLMNLAHIFSSTLDSTSDKTLREIEGFRHNPEYLVCTIHDRVDVPTVLVVDQFEEVFTLCHDKEEQQAFIANLLGLVNTQLREHRVVLTLRSDFESQIVKLTELKPLFENSQVRVTALDAGELREAIENPAKLIGLRFEQGLVDELLNDVLGEPAALPLLQFTLLKLWEKRNHDKVTWETYRQLDGGRKALAITADEFYKNLIPEEQLTMRRILLRLVRPTAGLEVTSKRILKQELFLQGEAKDRVSRVLEKLHQEHLIRFTEDDNPNDIQVEIAHEALIRNWPLLIDWVNSERDNLRQRNLLTDMAEQWSRNGRDPDSLIRGQQLEEAQQYDDLNELEQEFIRYSQEEQKRQEDERRKSKEELLAVSEKGLKSLSIAKNARYYYGPSADDIRAIVQALESNLTRAETSIDNQELTTSEEILLPIFSFEEGLSERINPCLTVLEELQKGGQLHEEQVARFNKIKQQILSKMEVLKELRAIENQVNVLLAEVVNTLTEKLQTLEGRQDNVMIEVVPRILLQEQIKLLQQFAQELEDGKVVARWLDRKRANGLARILGQYTLDYYSDIQNSASQEKIDAFYFTLDQFLDNLSHCLIWGRKNSLENPVTPVVIEDELYIFALEYLGLNLLPANLPSHSVVQLRGYIAYLIERLPDYEHVDID
jgi:hypothetical protein